ncbi:MAG: ester cyclase [Chloroflexi bacterium]|nr:ester cyclase [Chloroflexota bacterium]
MKNFAPEFKTPEQYIIDVTYKIWEERGIGRIRDWYAPEGPVRTAHGESNSVEAVVQGTLETLHEFPDRQLLPEDIIIGTTAEGFLSSHRVRSTATHSGDGFFGAATNRPLMMLTVADCLCENNQVVEEWLVRDQAGMAIQLGLDPKVVGRGLAKKNPGSYQVGNEAMRKRWSDPNGITRIGDEKTADHILKTYDAIWNDKNLNIVDENYDRAIRLEGPSGFLDYGRFRTGGLFGSMLASIPDGRFEPHYIIVQEEDEKAPRVSLRWSYCGTHKGRGRYGNPSGAPLSLLGISHFELRKGKIVNEWMLLDETAIYAQIAANTSK